MSDYVTRLAARSLDKLDVVKPRPPTMFEPPRVKTGFLSAPSFIADMRAEEVPLDETMTGTPMPPARQDQSRQMEGPLAEGRGDDNGRKPAGDRPAPVRLPSGKTMPAAPRPLVQSPGPGEPETPELPQRGESSPATTPRRSVEFKQEQDARRWEPDRVRVGEHQIQPATALPLADAGLQLDSKQDARSAAAAGTKNGGNSQSMTAQPASRSSEARVVLSEQVKKPPRPPAPSAPHDGGQIAVEAQLPVSSQHERAAIRGTYRPQERITPQSSRLRPAWTEKAASEPASTIHVTIGRIEVRATNAAPPPARRETAMPTMSLEEYLRQRTCGGVA